MTATAAALTDVTTGSCADEFLLDPGPVYTPAPGDQLTPAIASNGTNSLIVWSDARSGAKDIYAARFTSQGTILDPAGITVCGAANSQSAPAVASCGTGYLVVWADERGDTSDIYAARVAGDGSVLDPAGIAVSTAAGFQGEPAVAFDGTTYLVVWTDMRGDDADIYGARVTRDGAVLDTSGIALVAVAADQTAPAACYDSANFLLVWADTRDDVLGDIYGARVTSEGAALDSAGFPISLASNWQGSPAIARGPAEVLVVWHDMRSSYATDVYGSRVSRAGVVMDSAGIAIAADPDYQWLPKAAFDGTDYVVAWVDQRVHGDIFGRRVRTDGSVLAPFLVSHGGEYESHPAVAFDGTYSTIAWHDARPIFPVVGYNVYATRVDSLGGAIDPGLTVSTVAAPQERPAAAFGGSDFLVVWDEARETARDIRGVRLTPEGAALDTPSIRISPPGGNHACAAAAHGMDNSLVVWENGLSRNRDVGGARVGPDGEVLDPAGIVISAAPWEQCAPAAASDGTDYLVAWHDWRNRGYDIYCARVSRAGALLDTAGVAVCTTRGDQVAVAMAYNGSCYLLVWQSQTVGARDVWGARISRQGVVLDPGGFLISDSTGVQPAVASDGADFFVVWSDLRGSDADIHGARVTGAGTVLDTAGIGICSSLGPQSCPAVAYDGADFIVVWRDERTGEPDLHGARVTPQGSVVDTFAVTTQQGGQFDPALCRGPGSEVLVAYSGWTGLVANVPYNSIRVWGTLSPAVGIEEGTAVGVLTPQRASTVVRNELRLDIAGPAELIDMCGRRILDLTGAPAPGASGAARRHDVRHLSPGVYFVVGKGQRDQGAEGSRQKVVIAR